MWSVAEAVLDQTATVIGYIAAPTAYGPMPSPAAGAAAMVHYSMPADT